MLTGITGWFVIWFGGAALMAVLPFFSRDDNDAK